MEIQSINSQMNFKSNMPIYKVLTKGADGIERELKGFAATRGPVQSLISRINNGVSPEALFFKKYLKDFRQIPKVTSTIVGNSKIAQRHLLFGTDGVTAQELREACYRHGNMTEPEINDYIAKTLIQPLSKKIRGKRFPGDTIGEQVGLVLHANKKNGKYNLNFEITNIEGKVKAKCPAIQPELPQHTITPQAIKKQTLTQPDLVGLEIPTQKSEGTLPVYFDHSGYKKRTHRPRKFSINA